MSCSAHSGLLCPCGCSYSLTGVFGSTAGAGRKPPSVPIWIIDGPAVAGSGTPPSLPSVGQVAGHFVEPGCGIAGTILTSVRMLFVCIIKLQVQHTVIAPVQYPEPVGLGLHRQDGVRGAVDQGCVHKGFRHQWTGWASRVNVGSPKGRRCTGWTGGCAAGEAEPEARTRAVVPPAHRVYAIESSSRVLVRHIDVREPEVAGVAGIAGVVPQFQVGSVTGKFVWRRQRSCPGLSRGMP